MKNPILPLIIVLSVLFIGSCDSKLSFRDKIKQDVSEKIASGFCENDQIVKDAEIKNLKIGEITPIGNTGMIDVSLEFDVVDSDGTEQHLEKAMLYIENGASKTLAIFCDYDYRDKN